MKPSRFQLKRTKGWRMPSNTVKVDRTTKWGNPFRIGSKLMPLSGKNQGKEFIVTHAIAVKMHRTLALGKGKASQEFRALVRRELRGKNLACWCPLPKPGKPDICHADVLLEIANRHDR